MSISTPNIYTLSDLHTELLDVFDRNMFDGLYFDILILAGDIGQPHKEILKDFLQFCSKKCKYVVYVPGNHEFWGFKGHDEIERDIKDICNSIDHIYYLSRHVLVLPEFDVSILGCTLWSKSSDTCVSGRIADYRRIKKRFVSEFGTEKYYPILPADTNKWHVQDLDWLTKELECRKSEACIVATHHAPLIKECLDNPDSPLTFYFASDQSSLIDANPQIILWVYGHTHQKRMFTKNKCTIWSNPIGYPDKTV